jgi:uncharacterized protein with NAD-binding domain and iron-sulfur cluster
MALHVIVIGGGVAGLTAAHELIDRGVAVTVYERRQDWGTPARTSPSTSGSAGRLCTGTSPRTPPPDGDPAWLKQPCLVHLLVGAEPVINGGAE